MPEEVSAADPYQRQRVNVLDSELAYIDTQPDQGSADGDAVVFLHGNPTSSYLWRNVIPHVESLARCLAPDLIGMGDSGTSGDGSYRFADHARYLDAWFDAVLPEARVTLVIHDWGSSLGLDWARRHPQRVRAVCYMEAFLAPFPTMPAEGTKFALLRSEQGEELVLEQNYFIEQVLAPSVTPEALEVYRRPYLEPGPSRLPTLVWPREVPFADGPEENAAMIRSYAEWFASSELPKLLVSAEPGALLRGPALDLARTFPNQTEVSVEGRHYIQEQAPHAIGEAIAAWWPGTAG